jgi:hypothetical protein
VLASRFVVLKYPFILKEESRKIIQPCSWGDDVVVDEESVFSSVVERGSAGSKKIFSGIYSLCVIPVSSS